MYAGLDAIYVRRLLPVLLAACGPFAHLARLDTWLAAQATGITVRGLRLDTGYTRGLLADLEAEHAAADAQITAALGCPGGSPKFAEWLDAQRHRGGHHRPAPHPDRPVAGHRRHARRPAGRARRHGRCPREPPTWSRARLAMSKASNLIANLRGFLAAADPAGRVHPQVNTLRAKTARMSITDPALQTLKKHDPRLRRCFTADPGHVLISCDFSQVEIRVAAALADDPTLKQVILSGADIHDATAALMYGEGFTDEQRTISKRATFGTIYGGGARALASQTGVTGGHRPAGDPAVAAHLPARDRLRASGWPSWPRWSPPAGGASPPTRPARTRTPTTPSSPPPGTCCSPPSTPWSPATRWAGCGCSCMTRSSSRLPSTTPNASAACSNAP